MKNWKTALTLLFICVATLAITWAMTSISTYTAPEVQTDCLECVDDCCLEENDQVKTTD